VHAPLAVVMAGARRWRLASSPVMVARGATIRACTCGAQAVDGQPPAFAEACFADHDDLSATFAYCPQ
jgi:hypothetical protein